METILGLDLGTNSIGWAIVEKVDDDTRLIDEGVCIFQEGVAREKDIEKPTVQERTNARASRRHYFRRRLRKIETLKVLVTNGFCPYLPGDALMAWKEKNTILWMKSSCPGFIPMITRMTIHIMTDSVH